MKIKVQEYGEMLYKLLVKNEGKKTDRLFDGFLLFLEENGDLGKIESIIRAFDEYYKKEEGLTTVTVTVARKIDADLQKTIIDYVKKMKPLSKKIELTEKIDPTILGGIKITADDIMFDGTIKKQIINLKNTLIQ